MAVYVYTAYVILLGVCDVVPVADTKARIRVCILCGAIFYFIIPVAVSYSIYESKILVSASLHGPRPAESSGVISHALQEVDAYGVVSYIGESLLCCSHGNTEISSVA